MDAVFSGVSLIGEVSSVAGTAHTVKLAVSDALAPLESVTVMVSLYVPIVRLVLGWMVNCAVLFGAMVAVSLVKPA